MSAAETLAAAQAAGVRLGLDGTDLLIESDHDPPPELLDALRRDKPEILALLRTREVGEETAASQRPPQSPNLHGLTLAELEEAAGEDWPEVRDDPAVLEALAHAVVTRRQRERGECPPHWTEHCECAGCGPVYLWRGSPASGARLPLVLQPRRGTSRSRGPWPSPVVPAATSSRIDHPHLGHCDEGRAGGHRGPVGYRPAWLRPVATIGSESNSREGRCEGAVTCGNRSC